MSPKTAITNRHLKDLLSGALREIETKRMERPDQILAGWGEVIDPQWRGMTEATAFEKGTLMVKVKNSGLYSLLVQQHKRLEKKLQEKFPQVKKIIFRIGSFKV
jgi:hypothetical protein